MHIDKSRFLLIFKDSLNILDTSKFFGVADQAKAYRYSQKYKDFGEKYSGISCANKSYDSKSCLVVFITEVNETFYMRRLGFDSEKIYLTS